MQDMTPDEIHDFLADARIGRLCMAGRDGRPYSIPLPFCWLDGAVYVRLPLTGRKGQILAENDRVCFEADDFTDTLDDYASVLVEGRLLAVTDAGEKQRVREASDEKYRRLRGGHRPGHGRARPAADLPVRKLVAEQVGGRRKERGRPAESAGAGSGAESVARAESMVPAGAAEGAKQPW
jgi:nitroimidazol reductase NimA-like FMN-containing flavoprotein (pyridoxamine 5'-phosphate oxidase superfamily)